jgi:hypothetical protein
MDSNLGSFAVPESVTTIGDGAFGGCYELSNFTIIGNSQLTNIGIGMFNAAIKLNSIRIPNQVQSIGEYAFFECIEMTAVTFDANSILQTIGNFAFQSNFALTEIAIPASVETIGEFAFDQCVSLTTVTFGENSQLTTIATGAFSGDSLIAAIEFPNNLVSLGSNNFPALANISFKPKSQLADISPFYILANTLHSLTIPQAVSYIKDGAFQNFLNLTNLTFQEKCRLSNVGHSTFMGDVSLTSVEIPSAVVTIGDYAFKGCTALGLLTFAEPSQSQLSTIGNYAFAENDIVSVFIPPSTKRIGDQAFRCHRLSNIIFQGGNQVTYLGNNVAADAVIGSVTLPYNLSATGTNLFHCSPLISVNITPNFRNFNLITEETIGVPFAGMSTVYTFGTHTSIPPAFKYTTINFIESWPKDEHTFKTVVRSTDQSLYFKEFDAEFLITNSLPNTYYKTIQLQTIGAINGSILPLSNLSLDDKVLIYIPLYNGESVMFTDGLSKYILTQTDPSITITYPRGLTLSYNLNDLFPLNGIQYRFVASGSVFLQRYKEPIVEIDYCCVPKKNNDPRRFYPYIPPTPSLSDPLSHAEYLRLIKLNNGALSSNPLRVGQGKYAITIWTESLSDSTCSKTRYVPEAHPRGRATDAGMTTMAKGAIAAREMRERYKKRSKDEWATTYRRKGTAIAINKLNC